MTPDALRAFLTRNGLSQAEAARQLEVSRNTIAYYLSGKWPIPRVFELALEALERKR
jgi:transcriptional regulator with XRE-family HTH domain